MRSRALAFSTLAAAFAVIVAACGGSNHVEPGGSSGGRGPKPGGSITYALDGKTTNFCIPGAQLAISGIMVATAVYDTLTAPTRDPLKYAPYLAKDVQPNDRYDQWTITLRPGVTFQDGTPVNSAAVKQNIDAWRKGTLLQFMYGDIADVATPDASTVVVSMKSPWVSFPAWLWNIGRAGIAAPAQLNAGAACATTLIGSGPFKVTHFDPSTGDVATEKNPDYWRAGYPYLDELDFKVSEGTDNRLNGLQGGQFDIMLDSSGASFETVKSLPNLRYQVAPAGRREIGMVLFNVTRPPLDDVKVRRAIAQGTDREALNEIANKGSFTLTQQVVDRDVMGYLDHPGFPKYDPKAASKAVTAWKRAHDGKSPTFNLQSPADEMNKALAQEIKRQMGEIGITVNLPAPVDQPTIISQAIGNQVDAFLWRNYAGGDPDTLYVWFKSGSLVNFNKINDPTVDAALDAGRAEPDPSKRTAIYQRLNRRLSTQAYNLYTYYVNWYVAEQSNVKGILGPNLPDANGKPGTEKPVDVLAGYHQLLGLWVDR
ncbi:MAG: ABC transporter substrate-binding protein [Acidimicrobiia bacterium]